MKNNRGGFAGKILYVDLTTREIGKRPLNDELTQTYIGGLGLCLKLAYDNMRPGTDALSPANPIVIGAGPLVGTSLPSSSRVFAVTKLPTSSSVGWCGAGGVNFGYLFKNAGYDHVVIHGKSDHPVYLKIFNDRVEICDANALWGKDVEETCSEIRSSFDLPVGVAAIGQAGENRVRFSMAFIDGIATLGRGSALPWHLFGTMELGQLMEPRGPHVGSGGSPTYFARRPLEVFPRHLERMGVPREAIERILPGIGNPQKGEDLKVGSLLKYSHAWFTILGSLGICARGQINRFYNASLCAELYETVTEIQTSIEYPIAI